MHAPGWRNRHSSNTPTPNHPPAKAQHTHEQRLGSCSHPSTQRQRSLAPGLPTDRIERGARRAPACMGAQRGAPVHSPTGVHVQEGHVRSLHAACTSPFHHHHHRNVASQPTLKPGICVRQGPLPRSCGPRCSRHCQPADWPSDPVATPAAGSTASAPRQASGGFTSPPPRRPPHAPASGCGPG